ncbi:hypothetical protein [Saccharibacillus sacchari]|uniref:hypothetical protein n=1 Tax=Saccharibacillus sacchari TaxID=456493 RepID=UPI0030ECDE38
MRKGILLFIMAVLVLVACSTDSTEKTSSVQRIKLTCKMAQGDPPCASLESEDPKVVAIVENAVANAEEMPGMLNYAAESILRISTGEEMDIYDLNLGSDREQPALLVKWPDTSTGYEIAIEDANRLREVFGR